MENPQPAAAAVFSPAKLTELRKAKKLSQDHLGGLCDVSGMSIRNWEAGKHTPDVNALARLAAALDVSIEDFFTAKEA